jgi:hypothetical protein
MNCAACQVAAGFVDRFVDGELTEVVNETHGDGAGELTRRVQRRVDRNEEADVRLAAIVDRGRGDDRERQAVQVRVENRRDARFADVVAARGDGGGDRRSVRRRVVDLHVEARLAEHARLLSVEHRRHVVVRQHADVDRLELRSLRHDRAAAGELRTGHSRGQTGKER